MLSLHIESVAIHDEEATQLAEMLKLNRGLQGITLLTCGINAKGLAQIASGLKSNKQIKYIDLRHNSFKDKGPQALAAALQEVRICQSLMLEGIETEDANTFSAFQKLLEDENCQISNLGLNAFGIGKNTVFKLIGSIKNMKNLQQLSLAKNACSI